MKEYLKVILINILLTLLLLIIFESIIYGYRKFNGKIELGFVKVGKIFDKNINDDCKRFRTHPILSHIHDHNNECIIKGGKANGQFVEYKYQKSKKKQFSIVTLGGSTTDGFYQFYSNGNTYPYLLNQYCNKYTCEVINGGTGGYNSSNNLLKLLTEVLQLNKKVKYIVLLSGINDIPFYSSSEYKLFNKNTYLSDTQLWMFENKKWINKSKSYLTFFPNIQSLFFDLESDFFFSKKDKGLRKLNTNAEKSIFFSETKRIDNSENWNNNITLMREISLAKEINFLVFLQPTMGLNGVQSKITGDKNNDQIMLKDLIKENDYLQKLNETYSRLKKHCEELTFCFDISDIAPPSGNNYSDPRHHNEKGNQIIANEIFDTLIKYDRSKKNQFFETKQ